MAARTVIRQLFKICAKDRTLPRPLRFYSTSAKPDTERKYEGKVADVLDKMEDKARYADIGAHMDPIRRHFRECLDYNAVIYANTDQKQLGVWMIEAFRNLVPDASERELERASTMGSFCEVWPWGIIVADDIIDQSPIRESRAAWHELDGVKDLALNDAFLIENTVYQVVADEFKGEPALPYILDLFHESSLVSTVGQYLDMKTTFDQFSKTRHNKITEMKAGIYYQLPLDLALHMSGNFEERDHLPLRLIGCRLGQWRQEQDDIADCYGPPVELGRDIEDGKCTWLIVKALEKCSDKQKQLLQENYGKPGSEGIVKEIYDDLELLRDVHKNQLENYDNVMDMITRYDGGFDKTLLRKMGKQMLMWEYP